MIVLAQGKGFVPVCGDKGIGFDGGGGLFGFWTLADAGEGGFVFLFLERTSHLCFVFGSFISSL